MNGAEPIHDPGAMMARQRARWRRKRVLGPALLLGAVLLALLAAWLLRERIADNVIASQLRLYDIPAQYEIARIGGRRQVLRDLVVGDPRRPDLTAERVEVEIVYRFGTPQIGRLTLTRPRLYGRWTGRRMSFGTLDRVLYRDSGQPPGLPALDVAVQDGRALFRTPLGPLGVKLDGAGQIADGFAGTIAVSAPALSGAGCRADETSLYGRVTTSNGKPRFAGPLRIAGLGCPGRQLALRAVAAELDLTAAADFTALEGRAALTSGPVRHAAYGASGAQANLRGGWRNGLYTQQHSVVLRGVSTPQAAAALVTLEGTLRATDRFGRIDFASTVEGNGMRPGPELARALFALRSSGTGTLVEPLAMRFAAALDRQARGSALSADLTLRYSGGVTSVMIPRAQLRGRGGASLVSVTRVEAIVGGAAPRLTGNIATGGPDMPRLTGRMERGEAGRPVFRLAMAPYAAGSSILAIPQLSLVQGPGGALGFSGRVVASGPLPGGSTRGLNVPVSGRWTPGGTLSLWRGCVDVSFERLQYANLALGRRGLTLCPPSGRAIVERGAGVLRIAAGTPRLDLAGTLGTTPIHINSGPAGFAWPGVMTGRDVAVALGPAATASRFAISNLEARVARGNIAGRFSGADVRLNAVPLDLREATGTWRYGGGALTLANGNFRLIDRQKDARFEPLVARNAALRLSDNRIVAAALLRHPGTDRVVSAVDLAHDLSTGRGFADLAVPGLLFDPRLQPVSLTRLALGVVANTRGTITGTGRVDWGPGGVTSTGMFSSDALDFAAAFGPVRGAQGTVRFDDLIGLTTAPGQTLRIGAVNPGIEVNDGEIIFRLRGGRLLSVDGGSWPFMGGRLILQGVDLNLGTPEARRYVFAIQGLDASAFVARFALPNIAATGVFDGVVPIVFDAAGNGRIEGGQLISRAPGGNVSYVGELTYKDLSPIANFAFDALRSLDYQQMTIGMDGPLTGEIVTTANFDGVRQGAGARRNIVTRALARLPIQFRINIRAPFYQLITSFKSLRDPAAVRDPRSLGLLSDDGTRLLKPEVRGDDVRPEIGPDDIIPGAPAVQN